MHDTIASVKPWYYETPGSRVFNEWTITHVAWGVLWGAVKPGALVSGILFHTTYELIEGYIFAIEDRDTSMRNHIGDTLAFLAGALITGRRRR